MTKRDERPIVAAATTALLALGCVALGCGPSGTPSVSPGDHNGGPVTVPTRGQVRLAGTVACLGKPAARALVAVVPGAWDRSILRVRTNERGEFDTAVAPGTYNVTATSSECGSGIARVDAHEGDRAAIDVQLRPGASLRGTVELPDGKTPANAVVRAVLYDLDGGTVYYAPVGNDGSYALSVPPASYALSVHGDSLRSPVYPVTKGASGANMRALRTDHLRERAPQDAVDLVSDAAIPVDVSAQRSPRGVQALASRVATARVVSLGEATHGTYEFNQVKRRLVQTLVSTHGFRTIAFEANWHAGLRVDDYVRHRAHDRTHAMSGLYRVNKTEEIRDLIDWLRTFNRDREPMQQVGFVGIDMQAAPPSVEHTRAYLHRVDPDELSRADAALALLEDRSKVGAYVAAHESVKTRTRETLRELLAAFDSRRTDYVDAAGESAWHTARRHVEILLQAESLLVPDELVAGNRRDELMAANVRWATDRYPGGSVIVWAHNAHVGTLPYEGLTPMGAHLRRMFGTAHFSVGFAFGGGTVRAYDFSTGAISSDDPVTLNLTTAGPGLLEELFGRVDLPAFALVVRELGDDTSAGAWLARPRLTRQMGFAYTSADALEKLTTPLTQFDAWLFVANTTAARGLKPASPPKEPSQ